MNHQQILREWSENRSGLWVELVEVELQLIPIDIANTCTHVANDFVMYQTISIILLSIIVYTIINLTKWSEIQ